MIIHYTLLLYIVVTLATFVYLTVNAYAALNYHTRKQRRKGAYDLKQVTALIPVYNEDAEIFASCIDAVRGEGVGFVVVGDSSVEPYKSMTELAGGRFVACETRMGKRGALARGMKYVGTEYVLLLDSDTVVPRGGIGKLLSNFSPDVGGVGTSARVRITGENIVSYMAEFFNRIRDTTFKAMSYFNTAMVLSGWCVMYRTEAVRDFMSSEEYTENRVLGMKSLLADDRHITRYVSRSGYRVLIDYDVVVTTEAPTTIGGLIKQMVRWSRAGYLYFFKEVFDGTYLKASKFYSFEMIYMYLLPVLLIPLALLRTNRLLRVGPLVTLTSSIQGPLIALERGLSSHYALLSIYYALQVASFLALAVFVYAILKSIHRKKLKTLAAGLVVMGIASVVSVYGLLTMFRQNDWITRQVGSRNVPAPV